MNMDDFFEICLIPYAIDMNNTVMNNSNHEDCFLLIFKYDEWRGKLTSPIL